MANRSDPPTVPSQRGPWPEVTDLDRVYDRGHVWCVNRAGHPQWNDDYPDAELHRPWDECRTDEFYVADARRDLSGATAAVSVYVAAPFQFGLSRDDAPCVEPRLVLDIADDDDVPPRPVSISLGEALRLARVVHHLVDAVTFLPDQP